MSYQTLTGEELEEIVYRRRSSEKLTKALSARPAPPELLLDAWVELQAALLYICQEGNERRRRRRSKLPADEFLPCGDNRVQLVAHCPHRCFSMHLIFEPEAQRIRWHSGERRDEFSIGVEDGKLCLLSRLHDPYYTVEEAAEFLYAALVWDRY